MITVIPAHSGLPDITVLLTSKEEEAKAFIDAWRSSGYSYFGLDLEWKPNRQKGMHSRSALLQVSAGPWVLVFDLKAIQTRQPRPLPDILWYFLENAQHTFYGMGLLEDAARLAFEFDCVVYGIDFAQGKAWNGLYELSGGLSGLANRVLGTSVHQSKSLTLSNWDSRPLTGDQIQYLAEDAYMSWALAQHFISINSPRVEWYCTMGELYGRGRSIVDAGMSVRHSVHDWQAAEEEWSQICEAKAAAKQAQKTLQRQEHRHRRRDRNQEQHAEWPAWQGW